MGEHEGKGMRGFASMNRAKQREIAVKGGKAAHAKGTAHEFTSEEAREAGRKSGRARRLKRGRTPVNEGTAGAPVTGAAEESGAGQVQI